ncbi:MAG: hypothetical protein ABW252_08010 [Polyangiales bacterium]
MSASTIMLRHAALAGLITLALGARAEAQSRDAGTRDTGRPTQAQTEDDDEEDESDDGDDVMYVGDGRDRGDRDDTATVGEVQVAGGGIGCALGGQEGASGALLATLFGLGLVAARRRR